MWSSTRPIFDEPIQSLRDTPLTNETGTSSSIGSATEHSVSDACVSASDSALGASDAPIYRCSYRGDGFPNRAELHKHVQIDTL